MFAKVCASVYGVFYHSDFGLHQSCDSNWSHLFNLVPTQRLEKWVNASICQVDDDDDDELYSCVDVFSWC